MKIKCSNYSFRLPLATRVKLFAFLTLTFLLAALLSCREKVEKRSFEEVKGFDAPAKQQEIKMPLIDPSVAPPMQHQSDPSGKLMWELPQGWESHGGGGMYYAIFKNSAKEDALQISVIALYGEAGGLEANTSRWLGQLGIELNPTQLTAFLNKKEILKTKSKTDLTFLDFGSNLKEASATSMLSMLVGIYKPGEFSYFIKITGPKDELQKEKKNFIAFCRSLSWKAE